MGYNRQKIKDNVFADNILKTIVDIIIVVVLAILVLFYFGEGTSMNGNSMLDTINNEEKLLLDKFSSRFTSFKRYDIIAFGNENSDEYNIKRIIALPGETVIIKEGCIYVNDEKIEFKEDSELIVNAGLASEEIKLDDDEYFVMGDNWNNSEDSRFVSIGNVNKENIIGRIWFRISPFENIGALD